MSSNSRQQQLPTLFNGSSYEFWSIKMKTLLKSEGLWEFVETAGYPQAASDQQKEDYEKQDAKALFFIQQSVDESVFSKIATATSAKQAWTLLENIYQGSNMEYKPKSPEESTDIIVEQILLECIGKGEPRHEYPAPSIFTIPRTHRDLNEKSFKPRIVSIGPLHRQDEDLQANEGEKAAHVVSLLSRDGLNFKQSLKACVHKVNASIERIRSCYAETIIYTNTELAKMMVTDACFVLEFLYRLSKGQPSKFGNSLFFELAFYDLLLLENQIPFFVLEDIFKCTIYEFDQNSSLVDNIIHEFIVMANPFKGHKFKKSSRDPINKPLHILGIMQEYYHYKEARSEELPGITLPTVVDLDRAGVNFKPVKDTDWPLVMQVKSRRSPCCPCFWGMPTLIMPALTIDDFTGVVLTNLIAYEQFSVDVPQFVTSYAMIMDMLVNTEEDIAKMVESKVLVNLAASNHVAADMINSLCKEVFARDCFYVKQLKELDKHYNGWWGSNLTWLRRTYFNNPWSFIALLAGTILFVLTVVQTVFTVKPEEKSNPKINGNIWK